MNQGNNDMRLLVVVGIAAMLLLFISFLLIFIFTQRKKIQYQQSLQKLNELQKNQLIEAAVKSEESERHRIAGVLHDEVGSILASSKLHFHNIKIEHYDDYSLELFKKSNQLLDESIKIIRGISHGLHSSILQEFGLNEAITHFAISIASDSLLEITTALDYGYNTLDPQNDMSIYRIVQELFNNIIKHAHAKNIRIKSVYADNLLQLTITHNGHGITQTQFEDLRFNNDGFGLKNILNRVILLKGSLMFSHVGSRYHIDIYIPRN
jgi:two-component system NarL family sensor kinase